MMKSLPDKLKELTIGRWYQKYHIRN